MQNTITTFTKAKAFAHFEHLWKACPHKKCRKRKTCTGGPRGTFRKTNGKPLCKTIPQPTAPSCQIPESLTLSNSDFLKVSYD